MVPYLVVGVVAALIGLFIGRAMMKNGAEKAAAKPKKFGADAARDLQRNLAGGGFKPGDGRIMELVTVANGGQYTVQQELQEERDVYAADIAKQDAKIKEFQAKIESAKSVINADKADDAEAAALAKALAS